MRSGSGVPKLLSVPGLYHNGNLSVLFRDGAGWYSGCFGDDSILFSYQRIEGDAGMGFGEYFYCGILRWSV